MVVALAINLTTYVPMWNNIPSFKEAEAIRDWQKEETPDEPIVIVSGDSYIEGVTRDYRDYDWTGII